MYGRKRRFGQLLRSEFPEYNKRYLKYIRSGSGRHGVSRRPFKAFKQSTVRALRPRALLRTGGLLPYPSNIERKFFDTAVNTDATVTATMTCVNAMVMGTTAITRIGRRILMKSLHIRGTIQREDPATTSTQTLRLAVFYDRQPNGAATVAAWTTIFDTATVNTFRNMENAGRFFCLMDEMIDLTAINGGNADISFEKYLKFNLPVYYNAGNAGNVADISTGSLIFAYLGNQAAGVDDINMDFKMRIRYTDM